MPIQEHSLRHNVETGIAFGSIHPDIVSDYEAREAAVYCRYNPREFEVLPVEEQARCVAQYRLHHLVANHMEDAVAAETERLSKVRR